MLRKVLEFINLRDEVESNNFIQSEIEKGVVFKGTNFWVLCFAIVVASVGLNTNSTAVIIGAMLISPLMGPINAIGFSVATYNFQLFKRAITNLSFAVGSSLLASTIYFALTPVSTAHSELLARIHPTIYDVLIAFFGGLSGILALSSKIKGNVLPGVAIATALMPPLCTAGYGLGTGQFYFFFGALYLFIINAVFIALANLLVVRYLKVPIKNVVQNADRKRTKTLVYLVMMVTVIPSIYFGYELVKEEQFNEQAEKYCIAVKQINDKFLLEHSVAPDSRKVTLVYGGDALTKEEHTTILRRTKWFELDSTEVEITQGITLNKNMSDNSVTDRLKNQNLQLEQRLKQLSMERDSILEYTNVGKQLLDEMHVLEPLILKVSVSFGKEYSDSVPHPDAETIVLIGLKNELNKGRKDQIRNWLYKRLNRTSIQVLFYLKKEEER